MQKRVWKLKNKGMLLVAMDHTQGEAVEIRFYNNT